MRLRCLQDMWIVGGHLAYMAPMGANILFFDLRETTSWSFRLGTARALLLR
jgi:hypothetical protein